jgi:uncharacterized protein GlcG (DUF336 family)
MKSSFIYELLSPKLLNLILTFLTLKARNLIKVPKLTSEDAQFALKACRRKALEIGAPMDIAVVDDGGNLLAFERMDGALVGCIQIAIDKAYTSAVLGISTAEEGKMAQPGGPEYGINSLCGGRIAILGGGIPIKYNNTIIGAIGCSSGTVDQDITVANAGITALTKKLSERDL